MSRPQSENSNLALFLMVDICGGFTNFSTFSKDALMMLQAGNILEFIAYISTGVIAGMALTSNGLHTDVPRTDGSHWIYDRHYGPYAL